MAIPAFAWLRVVFALVIISIGLGLGLSTWRSSGAAAHNHCGDSGVIVSSVIGWTYFAAWSLSFYPQAVLNYQRKSVVGLSLDYTVLNVVGFACYSAFNLALFYSPSVRTDYADKHHGEMPAVRTNDVFFSLHALTLSSVVLVQCAIYPRGGQRVSLLARTALVLFALGLLVGLLLVLLHASDACTWLNLLYALSFVKLGITLTKYMPQVYLNWSRKSTDGWNIDNVVLDFTGGVLSLGQLLMDAACQHDWSAVTGDPVKFGLGFASMVFDIVFMVQHFCLYRHRGSTVVGVSTAPVGGSDGDTRRAPLLAKALE